MKYYLNFARCYAVDENSFSYIIFEDISSYGFQNVDKKNGLDFDHMRIAFEKLAQWHAVTAQIIATVNLMFLLLFFMQKVITILH